MLFVVVYDIADSRRLARVARVMEDYGTRVQYSVFEVYADNKTLQVLIQRVLGEMDPRVDSVRVYPLCKDCEGNTEVIGEAVYVLPDEEVMVY